jgi:hypothetical protein
MYSLAITLKNERSNCECRNASSDMQQARALSSFYVPAHAHERILCATELCLLALSGMSCLGCDFEAAHRPA